MMSELHGNSLINIEEKHAVKDVLDRKAIFRYSSNAKVTEHTESAFKRYLGETNFMLMTNGTAALKCALLSVNPIPGQIVIIPAISFIATANASLSVGLVPVLVDTDVTGMMCPTCLESMLEKIDISKVAAVITVHLDGCMSQIEKILSICNKYDLPLIEDSAQVFGLFKKGKHAGTFGALGIFSFQENKILSSGEGGAIISNSDYPSQVCHELGGDTKMLYQ
jgi:dTDP-4-amino-4,6-dideoxygalactose transaminase